MSRFAGKVALIFGGAGSVGFGIVKSLVEEGATVIVPSRSKVFKQNELVNLKAALEQLKKFSGNPDKVIAIEGDVSSLEGEIILYLDDIAGAEKVKEEVQKNFKKVDYTVTSLGGMVPVSGPISKISQKEYDLAFSNYCTPHWIVAKTFLPWISQHESTYMIITGAGGESAYNPQMGHLTLGAAALFGLSQALQSEYKKSLVKLNEYRIAIRVVKDDEVTQPFETPTSKAGKAVVNALLQDVRGRTFRLDSINLANQIANKFD